MPRKSTRLPSKFPLFKHARGYWCKKVRGRLHYFGKVADDPRGSAALVLWLDQRDDLLAGRKPRPKESSGPTVGELLNRYLTAKEAAANAGEISARHLEDLVSTGKRIAKVFGRDRLLSDIGPDDFAALKRAIGTTRKQLSTIATEIVRAKAPFHWGYKNAVIDRPIRFGSEFSPPPKGKLRLERHKRRADWLYTPEQVRELLAGATVHLKAMILLGINCGFGPADCAGLPTKALDLATGWVEFPRSKTGIKRRAKLWPETVAALKASLADRPEPKEDYATPLVFVTKYGAGWCRSDGRNNAIPSEFAKLVARLKLARDRRGIYTLRHCFRTAASAARDVEAIRVVMGHASGHVEETYLHAVGDERLQAVADTVHQWLFGTSGTGGGS